MLDKLNNRINFHYRIIRNRYYWRIIADGTHPVVAGLMALVDCGDLVMRGLLFGRLS